MVNGRTGMIRLVFYILFAGWFSVAAQYKKDSLLSVYGDQSYSDSLRMSAIHLVGFHTYLNTNPDSAFICGGLEYDLAIKNEMYRNAVAGLTLQANSFLVRRDYLDALTYYNKALTLANEKNRKDVTIAIYGNMGRLLVSIGLFDSAMVCFNQALDVAYHYNEKKSITTLLNSIGGVFRERGDFVTALDFYEQALLIDLEIKNIKGLASDYGNIGNIFFAQSNYSKAEEFYKKALLNYERVGDTRGIGTAYSNLGGVYTALKKTEEAVDAYQRGMDIKIKSGDQKGIALLLEGISTVFYNQGNYEKSEQYLDSAIAIYKQTGEVNNLISAKIHRGKLLYRMNRFDEALTECNESYQKSKELKFVNRQYQTLDLLIQLNCMKSNYVTADSFVNELMEFNRFRIEQNFPILTEMEKEIYLNSISESMDLCRSFLIQTTVNKDKSVERELDNLIFFKGILLRSTAATRNSILGSQDSALIADYQNWLNLKQRIAKMTADGENVQDLESEANELEKTIMKKSSVFNEINRLKQMTWNDVQKGLKSDEVFVDFVHFREFNFESKEFNEDEVYYAFVISKTCLTPSFIRLFNESEIAELLSKNSGNSLGAIKKIYGTKESPGSELYNLIWKNLESELDNKKTVYLSLSGLLHKVSFAALYDGSQMLSEKHNLYYLNSPEFFINDETKNSEINSLLLYGGINYNTDSSKSEIWSYLPGTLEEVQEIGNLKTKKRISVLTGNDATEASFKNSTKGFDVIHIATHGFFYPDPSEQTQHLIADTNETENIEFRGTVLGYRILVENNNPLMRSGLVFYGANEIWSKHATNTEDGVLTASEVTDLDLTSTELVVLSACETGLGDIKGSEGVYGLQRSFKMAGVKCLIMSLWQVPDKETSEFMILFYRNLFRTGDIHMSFTNAQRVMKSKYDPYFWAAFVLVE